MVQKALQDLVEGVPGCPDALTADVPVDETFGEGAQVAVSVEGVLHFRQSGHDAVGFRLHPCRTRLRIERGKRREQMAGGVAAKVAVQRLPSAQPVHGHVAAFKR